MTKGPYEIWCQGVIDTHGDNARPKYTSPTKKGAVRLLRQARRECAGYYVKVRVKGQRKQVEQWHRYPHFIMRDGKRVTHAISRRKSAKV